jgi:hypothetical protein
MSNANYKHKITHFLFFFLSWKDSLTIFENGTGSASCPVEDSSYMPG